MPETNNVKHFLDLTGLAGVWSAIKGYIDSAVGAVSTALGNLTKSDVGLGNVDNTSDADKPVSTATQTALNAKADKSATVSDVTFDSASGKIKKTINGTTSDVVEVVTKSQFDTVMGGANASGAIDTFNEITAFLEQYSAEDTTLKGVIDGLASTYQKEDELVAITSAEIAEIFNPAS